MRSFVLGIILLLQLGCSDGSQKPSNDEASTANQSPTSKLPDNHIALADLYQRYKDGDAFSKIEGDTVSTSGRFNLFFHESGPQFIVQIKSKDIDTVNCDFGSSEILNQCMIGQEVCVEGTVAKSEGYNAPFLKDCKLVTAKGKIEVPTLTGSEFASGKKFPRTRFGILSGKVDKIVEDTSPTEIFIRLATGKNGKVCIQFKKRDNPDIEKIKNLKPGDPVRAIGSTLSVRSVSPEGYTIAINESVLLKPRP